MVSRSAGYLGEDVVGDADDRLLAAAGVGRHDVDIDKHIILRGDRMVFADS